nr:hypothetical protein [Streptomyces kebangsaanensis]
MSDQGANSSWGAAAASWANSGVICSIAVRSRTSRQRVTLLTV